MLLVTLVRTPTLSEGDIATAREILGGGDIGWLTEGKAADISGIGDGKVAELEAALPHVDVFSQEERARERKLFVADMDSTMISVECIDELADFAGLKSEIAAVTEAAMRGELDFEAALRRRVSLLEGLDEGAIQSCLNERVKDNPGARTLVATLKSRGVRTVLVSGGFTAFAGPVGERLGFDRVVANVLEIGGGKLTGGLAGPVVDAATKREVLLEEAEQLGIGPDAAIAMGDGANDLQMVKVAGLGVAFHAKPALAEKANANIRNGPLTTLLFALGIPEAEWTEA